jgi:hypothetical protein
MRINSTESLTSSLLIVNDDPLPYHALILGDAANGKTVTGFRLLHGSRLQASGVYKAVLMDNATRCNIDAMGYANGIEISSSSSKNKISTGVHNTSIVNNRTEKDNIILLDEIVTDAELAAIASPITGYRVRGRTTIGGEWYYKEGTGWTQTG